MVPPIRLRPILKHRAWGGRALVDLGRCPSPGEVGPFGESWELADLPATIAEGRSTIDGGPRSGLTLRQAIERDGASIIAPADRSPDGGFPLLVKLLHTEQPLSIQVHPDSGCIGRSGAGSAGDAGVSELQRLVDQGAQPKNEAWFIIRASPGAHVYRGIDPSLSRTEFVRRLDEDRLLTALVEIPVRAGDCVIVPGGICHALGAGLLAAEVGTTSDTTYRLWDWGRHDQKRPLHRKESLACLRVGREQRLDELAVVNASDAPAREAGGFRTVRLCRTTEFTIEHLSNPRSMPAELTVVTDGQPVIWIILEGEIVFEPPAEERRGDHEPVVARGIETMLLPASTQGWIARVAGGTRFLRVTLPDPASRMLAR